MEFIYKYLVEYIRRGERIRITTDDFSKFRATMIRILWDTECELIRIDVNKQLKEVTEVNENQV